MSAAGPPANGDAACAGVNLRLLNVFAGFALAALFVYLMVIAEAILLPLVLAIFIVILLDAIGAQLCRIPIAGRQLPDWVGMVLANVIFVAAFVALGNLIRSNIAAMTAAVPTYEANIKALIDSGLFLVGATELPSVRDLVDQIDVRETLGGVISALAAITGNTLTVVFYVAFILLEQVTFKPKIDALFAKTEDRRRTREMLGRITGDIQTYLGLKTLVSALTGVLSFAVMAFVGVDFATFWAVLIFVLNFIPYIGSLIGVLFSAVLTLVQFDTAGPFFITIIALTLVQLLVGNIIEPRLMGRSLNLSPLVILLSLAIFGKIWGVVGMVLSIPFMVIAMIACAGFEATRPIAILMSANACVDRPDANQNT